MKYTGSGQSVDSFGSRDLSFWTNELTNDFSVNGSEDLRNDRWDKEPSNLPPVPIVRCEVNTKIRWGGNTFHTIDGRPMYLQETFSNPSGLEELLEDRFASAPVDASPLRPRRSIEWSDVETASCQTDDVSRNDESECASTLCSIVWITTKAEADDGDAKQGCNVVEDRTDEVSKCTYLSEETKVEDDDDWSGIQAGKKSPILLRPKLRNSNLISRVPETQLLRH